MGGDEIEAENRILTTLSMNGRATLKFIGKQIGLTKHPTYRRVRQIEEKYGIKYIAEIDVKKLGYLSFLVLIKFLGKIPLNDLTPPTTDVT